MKEIFRKLIPVICLVPLVVGMVGYLLSGEWISNALYASFALYFTNPVSEAYNGCIEFARWTAPLVTATAILCVLKSVWDGLAWRVTGLARDSVAVYTDEDIAIRFGRKTRAVYPGERFLSYFKSHIILFASDRKSLQFFEEHRAQLEGKAVYIGLRELEMGLMREVDGVTFFDINSSIARNFWKKTGLWRQGKKEAGIVIYGDGLLAQNMLSAGLQLNLFSKEQHITHHVVSGKGHFQRKHADLPLLNGDEIVYHAGSEEGGMDAAAWEAIERADFVLVADLVSAEMLQTIAVKTGEGKLYYYSPVGGDTGEYMAFGKPAAFGRNEEIFTDENIRRQKLIQAAMALNGQYAEKYGTEKDWNRLSGFLKSSNISSADFHQVLKELASSVPEEELAELEHIRWGRFYSLNYWKQGSPEGGGRKDDARRIHRDLVPYSTLSEEEKEKDRDVVKRAAQR